MSVIVVMALLAAGAGMYYGLYCLAGWLGVAGWAAVVAVISIAVRTRIAVRQYRAEQGPGKESRS